MESVITFGSLFAGIGGFDLGLERAGMECKWQVEIDDYGTRVLEKHWPHVKRWRDVRTFPPDDPDDWRVDCICGGFPCQDISYAGKGAGLDGERSGLFFDAMRVVRELEPRCVVLENVSALLTRGMDDVLGTLASIGFDAEWHCIPAAAVGAPHIRDRVFIIGHSSDVPNSVRSECEPGAGGRRIREGDSELADTGRVGRDEGERENSEREGENSRTKLGGSEWWATEPDVGRVAHGIPKRVDRVRGLGNAVVPQVAEWIGRRVMELLA